MKLDPARLVQDGDELYSIARTLDSAVSTLVSRLSGSGGMAGDDNAAEEFCEGGEGYDALAGPTIDGVSSFGNGLRIVDAALSNTARAYDGAQKPGAGLDPATASPAEATPTIDESKASVPSALGPGWPGPLGEFQELLEWGLAQIGVVIPTGDEDKLQAASDAWGTFGDSIQSARSRVASSMPNVGAMTLPQQSTMLSCRTSLAEGLDRMRESADGMQQWIADFRTQLRQMREELGWFLKQMAIEIAAELAIGGLLTVVTAGLGALATAAKVGTTVVRWCVKIAKLIDRLKDFLRGIRGIKGALVRGGLRAAREGLQAGLASAIATTSVNHMRADDKGYTPQDVGTAFISAFAGGAAASPASRLLGGSGGPGLRAGTRQVAGETGAGAIDGLVSSGVESGITGQEFNPISSMVLGSLIGGGMSAGGRGIDAVLPGNNANSPDVTTTTDAPTAGGGTGSGSNGSGSGTSVATDSSGVPTPGSGNGGGSPTGDGSSVDVSGDAPSTPDGNGAPDASGTSSPDASSPTAPDASAPSGPDASSPAAPDASAPSGPDASSPTAPDASAPSGPDAGAPNSPDAGAPSSPDAGAPSSPDAGAPSSPDAGAPSSPDAGAPSSSEVSAPAGPEASAPAAPASPVTSPDVSTPAASEASASSAADASAPAAPESSALAAPEATPTTQADAPVAAAPASTSSTSTGDVDGATPEAPAAETSAGTQPDTADPEASGAAGIDEVAPEDVAAVGGAAAIVGAAAMVGKPSFLPTHTPGGSTPTAPTSPMANPAGSAPGTSAAGSGQSGPGQPGSGSDGSGQGTPGQDGGAGDGGQPDTTGNHSDRTIDEIDAALAAINPNYDPSDPANGYATNCGNTSSILNDFLNGQSSSEATTGTLDVPQMEARTGNPQTPMTPAQIDASLRAMGPGSHCVVGIDRSTGDGHWFNAYFDGTTVWSLDAQTGSRSPWPPNEPNATNWDASIQPENVAPAAPAATSTTGPSAPSTPGDGAAPGDSVTESPKASTVPETAGGREASSRPTWTPNPTVAPNHPSDGSAGPGTTYNGYDIPELTPEIRQQLDALATRSDAPIVRNDDGSYSLREPIEVDAFEMKNAKHDWAEFQRQVGLQQQGLNNLTLAEWRHNVNFYDSHNRVAINEQKAAGALLKAAGVNMSGQAVLHGPDQVAGGRADRFDGAGSFGINSSMGRQWQDRILELTDGVRDAAASIDPALRPHIRLTVELGAVNVRDGGQVAPQAVLGAARPTTPPVGSTPAPVAPTAPAASATPAATRSSAAPVDQSSASSADGITDSGSDGGAQDAGGTAEGSDVAPEGSEGSEAAAEGSDVAPEGSEVAPEGSEMTAEGSEVSSEGPEAVAEGSDTPAEGSTGESADADGSEISADGPAQGDEPAGQDQAEAESRPEDADPAEAEPASDASPATAPPASYTVEGHGASQAAIDQARVQADELFGGLAPENRALMATRPVTIDVIPHGTKLTELAPYAHLAGKETFDGRQWADVRGIQTEVDGVIRVAIGEEGLISIGVPSGYGPGFLAAHEGGHGLQYSSLTPAQITELAQLHAARLDDSGAIDATTPPGAATAKWLEPAWYSAANMQEYFANSVAAYLGHPYSHSELSATQYTRGWLEANDPKMHALLEQVYGAENTP
ncbi:polymorphic toxin type 15 domain-containing protein [Agromyces sp. Soil535]|uniref:polymorphic toxin type 15 domain-containing protein n=1 Tax=Agromyces sp. Soil535 TaxID=1736390 RepID=UPI00138F5715|nr:polymorphic toxin type 15 domain-containing protein [Agromyces sp. Soil535]